MKILRDATVLITGASAGIGAALARAFTDEGAQVGLAARRLDRLEALRDELGPDRALAVACDVTDRESIARAVAATAEAFGGIDICVANAGYGVKGPFHELSTEDFRRQFDVNFFGVIDTIKEALPYLEERRGQVVVVSSIVGKFATAARSAYASSKHAVTGLAEALSYELPEMGVSLTCVEPGLIESDFRRVDNENQPHLHWGDPEQGPFRMPADKAARIMLNAIAKKKTEAVVTLHGKAIVFFKRLFPGLFHGVMARSTRGRLEQIARNQRASRD